MVGNKKKIFEERTRLFMKYINEHDIVSGKDRLRFSDIDKKYLELYPNCLVFSWMCEQIYGEKLSTFKMEISKYQEVYDKAYFKIMDKIDGHKLSLSKEDKMKILMKYLNDPGVDIPGGRSSIRFCDIDSSVQDTAKVGVWIQTSLHHKEFEFIEMYSSYRKLYPIAYDKLNYKIYKRNDNSISEERMKVFVTFLQYHPIKTTDRFCDIGGHDYDKVCALNWYYHQLKENSCKLMEDLQEACDKYHVSLLDVMHKIDGTYSKKMRARNLYLKDRERIRALVRYLEDHTFSSLNGEIVFRDIDSKLDDDANVFGWFLRNICKYGEKFLDRFLEFEKEYPQGYLEVMTRGNKFLNKRKMTAISYSDKLILFMEYLEKSDRDWFFYRLSFSDLDDRLDVTSLVTSWISNEFQFRLPQLIEEIKKYENVYPRAYQKIVNKINDSDVRVRKERLLFLEELKKLRNQLGEMDNSTVVRNLKRK